MLMKMKNVSEVEINLQNAESASSYKMPLVSPTFKQLNDILGMMDSTEPEPQLS